MEAEREKEREEGGEVKEEQREGWREGRERRRGEERRGEKRNVHCVSLRPQVCHGLPHSSDGEALGLGSTAHPLLRVLACVLGRGWVSRAREEGLRKVLHEPVTEATMLAVPRLVSE